MLTGVLAVAALAAGLTGAWSPCGFSMVETLAPSGYAGRMRTTAIACATFAAGALAGGAVTFGGLSLLGAALGSGAPAVAALVALAAAVGEARGARIVPQVRRQVPESWRRAMPVPVAAGLYGVLLGLGFTTFILTFAVWALAGMSVALGDPGLGLVAGLAFGLGRALPVIALAPSGGGSLAGAMAERPRILRSLRALDAAVLAACAAALFAAPADARPMAVFAAGVADPSFDNGTLAVHRPGATGALFTPAGPQPVPGVHPAVGGGRLAWLGNGTVDVAGVGSIPVTGADSVAVSAAWVAWRVGQTLWVGAITPTGFGLVKRVVAGAVGRPALDGNLLLFDFRTTRIDALDLATGRRSVLRSTTHAQLRGPSALGGRLVYVRATYRHQQVVTGPLRRRAAGADLPLYGTVPTGRRDLGYEPGHEHAAGHSPDNWARPPAGVATTLTTTALAPDAAYVTRLVQRVGAPVETAVLRIAR
jgi:hypothetical protein